MEIIPKTYFLTIVTLQDGEALHAALSAIKHERDRIWLKVRIFAFSQAVQALADLLLRMALKGVRIEHWTQRRFCR